MERNQQAIMTADMHALPSAEGLKAMQQAAFDTLCAFDVYCRDHNLTYYIAYGTLLGAVRHGGFIPWDDDIDICMPRKDMQKLIDCFDTDFPKPYTLDHYTKNIFMSNAYVARICNPRVQFVRRINNEDRLFDTFISIFPIYGAPNSAIKRFLFEKQIDYLYIRLRFIRSGVNGYGDVSHSFKERIGIAINNILRLSRKQNVRDAVAKMDERLKKYEINQGEYISTYGYMITPMYYKKEWFGMPIDLKFGDHFVMAPQNPQCLLTGWYGNYMELPPKEKRKPSHSIKVIRID